MKQVRVTIGGVERLMRFDANAGAILEELGFDLFNNVEAALRSFRGIRAMAYAALVAGQMYEEGKRYREPALTLHEVGALLDGGEGTDALVAALNELIAAAAPEQQDIEKLAQLAEDSETPAEADGEAGKGAGESSTSTP